MKALGIIPARGGSKGVPRKNIRPLGGRPLLHYVLTAALRATRLSRVVVSSDDEEILAVAGGYGADVPLRRPAALALDTTPDVPVLQHAVKAIEEIDGPFDVVVQLHATTPFLSTRDIDGALDALATDPAADSVVSVYALSGFHPRKLKRIEGDRLRPYVEGFEEVSTSRRQDAEPMFKRNGGLYASRRAIVMEHGLVWGENVRPYTMPAERSLEVDTVFDFHMADLLMRHGGPLSGNQ
jgi:D-3-phosphoglycerate dehydrogenase